MLDELILILDWLKDVPFHYRIMLTNYFGGDGLMVSGALPNGSKYPLQADTINVLLSMFTFDRYNESMKISFDNGYYEEMQQYNSDERLVKDFYEELRCFVRVKKIDEILSCL